MLFCILVLSQGHNYAYTYTHIRGNIIKPNLRTSMNERTNERTHFFIKIYISHTLFSKGLTFLWCVRHEWIQGQTAILTQLLLLTIARCILFKKPLSTSSTSWLGLLNWGLLRSTSLSLQAGPLVFLLPTDLTATGTCLYSFITSTCFRFFFRLFTQVHLWLTAWSRVNI